MRKIRVERNPSPEWLQELGVPAWPVWTKEASEFPWTYDGQEVCYFMEGEVTVTCEDGETAQWGKAIWRPFRRAWPAPGR